MARFDWLAFLKRHKIDYVTRGQSTSRDNVNVHCPICGGGDTGHHLGISLHGKGWHCWRNGAHSGKSRSKLIQLLLRCDPETAEELAGGEASAMPSDKVFGAEMRQRFGEKSRAVQQPLRLLPEFKPITGRGIYVHPFISYLKDRGYKSRQIEWLFETYNLHYCTTGPFRWRLVIPVYDQWGRLLTWTARTIRPAEELRYRALGLTPTPHLPPARCHPQQALLGLRYLWQVPDPRVLLIVEGPFDAMWMTLWGKSFGVYATCLFGLNISQEQITQIAALQERFERRFMLLDAGVGFKAFRLANSGLTLPIKRLSADVKDPAVLPPEAAVSFCVSCLP